MYRTNKELIRIVLDNEDLFSTGICALLDSLANKNKITRQEADRLDKYLTKLYPPRVHGTFGEVEEISRWYNFAWKKGKWKPRKEFLNKLI